ncbi:2841_t:CDS:1, partial [Acaulospora colombiana]
SMGVPGSIPGHDTFDSFSEQESRSLKELYGPEAGDEPSWMQECHSPTAANEISRAIYQQCKKFRLFSMSDSSMDEEKEIELVHEKEVERVIERPQPATAAPHSIHKKVKKFVQTGNFPQNSGIFCRVNDALLHTSIPIPQGLQIAFTDLRLTQDFCRTITTSSSTSSSLTLFNGEMDHYIRPVEWLVIPNKSHPACVVVFSPFEVNELFNEIRSSGNVRLYVFAARNTVSMRPFDTLDSFIIPRQQTDPILPPSLIRIQNIS